MSRFELVWQNARDLCFIVQKLLAPDPAPRDDDEPSPLRQQQQQQVEPASLVIGWCTATGTAKRFALLASVDAQELGVRVAACSCCSELSLLTSVGPRRPFFLLLFVATQGDGDTPSSFGVFQRMFENECTPDAASSPRMIGCHVVALGDTSYRRYAAAGKDAAAWLTAWQRRSAAATAPSSPCGITYCDARQGAGAAEDAAEQAVGALLRSLLERNALETCSDRAGTATAPVRAPISCTLDGVPPAAVPFPAPSSIQPPSSPERPVELALLSCEVLSRSDGAAIPRTVVRLVFDALPITSRSPLQSGDHVAIFPTNSPELVWRAAAALAPQNSDADVDALLEQTLTVRSTDVAANRATPRLALPAAVSLRTALRHYPDLSGPPRRRFLGHVLATLCASDAERQAVRAAAAQPNSNVVDVLEAASLFQPSRRSVMSLEDFFFLCPRLMPRFFSVSDCWFEDEEPAFAAVASGSTTDDPAGGTTTTTVRKRKPRKAESATAAAVGITAKQNSRLSLMVALIDGGCFSAMIERVLAHKHQPPLSDERFFFHLRRTSFHPCLDSASKNKPAIFIGAGTGIAPFVGFCRELREHKHFRLHKMLQERQQQQHKKARAKLPGVNDEDEDIKSAAGAAAAAESGGGGRVPRELSAVRAVAKERGADGCCDAGSRLPGISSATLLLSQAQDGADDESKAPASETEQKRVLWPAGVIYGFTRRGAGSPFLELFHRSLDDGTLCMLEEAESRPAAAGSHREKKQYVQDRIAAFAAHFRKLLLDHNASIFICGRASMAADVEATIAEKVLAAHNNNGTNSAAMSPEGAKRFLEQMRSAGRLKLDVWE